jgi:hypothetical protein
MAKKKRKEEVEAEKYEFKPPDFDEKSFLVNDIKGTKMLMVAALLGIVLGSVAYLLTGVSALIGVVVLFAGAFLLKYVLQILRIDTEGVQMRTLAGNIVLLILLGLAIWIMLLNPPFSDHFAPEFRSNTQDFQHAAEPWEKYIDAGHTPIYSGDGVRINITVRDNGHIAHVYVEVPGVTTGQVEMDPNLVSGSYIYQNTYTASGSTATYTYTIMAVDEAGNSATTNGAFVVNPVV